VGVGSVGQRKRVFQRGNGALGKSTAQRIRLNDGEPSAAASILAPTVRTGSRAVRSTFPSPSRGAAAAIPSGHACHDNEVGVQAFRLGENRHARSAMRDLGFDRSPGGRR
jgi:hypothetical protein